MIIYGLDPGTNDSALVLLDTDDNRVTYADTMSNGDMLSFLRGVPSDDIRRALVVEQIARMGADIGTSVLDTVFWSGRFVEAWPTDDWHRVTRLDVKMYLCGTMRSKDSNVRRALLDMFGGDDAKGTKQNPGPLHGVKGHEFAALAVAVTWQDTKQEK